VCVCVCVCKIWLKKCHWLYKFWQNGEPHMFDVISCVPLKNDSGVSNWWLVSRSGNGLRHINKVTLCRARLVLRKGTSEVTSLWRFIN